MNRILKVVAIVLASLIGATVGSFGVAWAHSTANGSKVTNHFYTGGDRLCSFAGLSHVGSGAYAQFVTWNTPSRYSGACGSGAVSNSCISGNHCEITLQLSHINAGVMGQITVILSNNFWSNDSISWSKTWANSLSHNCTNSYWGQGKYWKNGANNFIQYSQSPLHACI